MTEFMIDMSDILDACAGIADSCGYDEVHFADVELSKTLGLTGFLKVDLVDSNGRKVLRVDQLISMLNDEVGVFDFGLHSTGDATIWLEFTTNKD
jgi:hypothetical protein